MPLSRSSSLPNSPDDLVSSLPQPQGIFTRVFRRLSLRRKSSSFERRKSSQRSLNSYDIARLYSDVDQEISRPNNERLATFKNEALYRGLLRSLLHPLGCPEPEIGIRAGDLVDHLREVFDMEQEDHEYFVRKELQNMPKKIQICVTLIEARDLKVPESESKEHDQCTTFCLMSIVNPLKINRLSPISSPMSSPRISPKSKRHLHAGTVEGDVLRSQPAKGLVEPKWNEEFYLEVDDIMTEDLSVCFFHQEPEIVIQGAMKLPEKGNISLKSIFRSFLASARSKYVPGSIGRIFQPVRDVPSNGLEKWFNIYPTGPVTSRTKPVGQCRLRLSLSYMQTGSSFSVEDYHQAALIHYKHASRKKAKRDPLPLKSRKILDVFATSNRISKLSQVILDLTVLLEMVATPDKEAVRQMSDSVLHKAVEEVEITWMSMQARGAELAQRMPLSDSEICLYRNATRSYITSLTNKLHDLPSLFPPSAESLATLKGSLGLAIRLLELDLWDSSSSPENDLADKLLHKIQSDVDEWITKGFEKVFVHQKVKDSVIPEVEALVEVMNELISHCTPLGVISQFYGPLRVKYYRVVAFRTERKVSTTAQTLMLEMDKYLLRYHSFPVNVNKGSRLSLTLYFSIRKFYLIITEGLTDRDMFRLTISQYQNWFQESLVFWLQIFKTECRTRMEKALEIDKDVVLVTSIVKFSNSSVDVLSCFAKITEEWRQIDFKDPDSVVMGVTKITDLICDGARLYADKIHTILERNCYYDSEEEQFDVTDRLCITLNNIEHVRQYLDQLPQLLQWSTVVDAQSARHEDSKIGKQSLATLQRLTSTAHHDILMKSRFLLREITAKMRVNIQRYMDQFIHRSPEKASAVDKAIGYLSGNLQTLDDKLMTSIYPKVIEELWEVVLQIFSDRMKRGEKVEYYDHMRRHIQALSAFFLTRGLEEKWLPNSVKAQLIERIELNCLKTSALMQEYFQTLSNGMTTPPEYLGHLAIKAAYVEETRGKVTIIVKVLKALELPGLDKSGLSDPYVLVSLQPPCLFSAIKTGKTKVVEKTLNPVFNETFQFPTIPSSRLGETGACVLFSVMDHDYMVSDDFAGEVILGLSTIQPITGESQINNMPVVMMPLKRPTRPQDGPFQVIEERSGWDREAKQFVIERMKFIVNQPRPQDRTNSSVQNFFSFFGFDTSNT